MTGRATMTGNATMTRRATGCLKKSGPRKKVFGHFLLLDGSIWTETMLYDQGISLRRSGYPTCLYSEKNWPQAPWGRFLATGPDFGPKICFCYRTPGFVNSYGLFRKKKLADAPKSLPHLRLPVTALALLPRGLDNFVKEIKQYFLAKFLSSRWKYFQISPAIMSDISRIETVPERLSRFQTPPQKLDLSLRVRKETNYRYIFISPS